MPSGLAHTVSRRACNCPVHDHVLGRRALQQVTDVPHRRHGVPAADHRVYTDWSYWVFRGKVKTGVGYQ